MCVFVCVCASSNGSKKKAPTPHGAGVRNGCDLPSMAAGNGTLVLLKSIQ